MGTWHTNNHIGFYPSAFTRAAPLELDHEHPQLSSQGEFEGRGVNDAPCE